MVFYRIIQSYLLRCALVIVTVHTEEVFNTTPPTIRTNFSCLNRPMGFYADVEANCRVYHTCDDHGNKFSYRCPEETAFRQDALICDHAHLVNCQATVYQTNENAEWNNNVTASARSPTASVDSPDDHRLSFSRSFQVVQRPDKLASNKFQSGFVFSASLFLKDQDRTRGRAVQRTPDHAPVRMCNTDSRNRGIISTSRASTERFDFWDHNGKTGQAKLPQSLSQSLSQSETRAFARDKGALNLRSSSFKPTVSSTVTRATAPEVTQRSTFLREKSFFAGNDDNSYRPYSETLRSIQINAVRPFTEKPSTEIPVHALTLSLKPLVPNELEYDPYYPKQPTSTEAYYTPSNRHGIDASTRVSISDQAPAMVARLDLPFEIPPVVPDLNNLEDLVDRRKFFYIPRVDTRSM